MASVITCGETPRFLRVTMSSAVSSKTSGDWSMKVIITSSSTPDWASLMSSSVSSAEARAAKRRSEPIAAAARKRVFGTAERKARFGEDCFIGMRKPPCLVQDYVTTLKYSTLGEEEMGW